MKLDNLLTRLGNSTAFDEDAIQGKFVTMLGKDDELSLSDSNIKDPEKRVAVIIHDGEDTPLVMACSTKLSAIVRRALKAGKSKSEILSALIGLNVMKVTTKSGDETLMLIPNPGELEKFSVKALKKTELKYEDLVAF